MTPRIGPHRCPIGLDDVSLQSLLPGGSLDEPQYQLVASEGVCTLAAQDDALQHLLGRGAVDSQELGCWPQRSDGDIHSSTLQALSDRGLVSFGETEFGEQLVALDSASSTLRARVAVQFEYFAPVRDADLKQAPYAASKLELVTLCISAG